MRPIRLGPSFRLTVKQDGRGNATVERVPQWGMDSSAKLAQRARNKSPTRRRVKPVKPQLEGLFTPVKKPPASNDAEGGV